MGLEVLFDELAGVLTGMRCFKRDDIVGFADGVCTEDRLRSGRWNSIVAESDLITREDDWCDERNDRS